MVTFFWVEITAGSGNGERMKENEQKTGKTPCIFKN